MGSNLGLDVIAEGVAIRAQESFLKKAGCRSFQGIYLENQAPPCLLNLR
jgi:EAL domain-containing protein (putative c-di-GMP-specific phosphodiesterase class I)